MDLKEIAKVILDYKRIGLTFHTSPDGDAIGSTLGLLNGLRELGKDVYVISREVIPNNLSFLPLGDEITGEVVSPVEGTDLVIVLDCGNVERICANLEEYHGDIINIDHHVSNEFYGKLNYVDSNSAATSEIVYLLLKELGLNFEDEDNKAVKNVGTCVYTSIVTDTGSFRHSNVTKRTHDISGELISRGINNSKIHNELFGNKPYEKVKFIGEALRKLELHVDNKVTYIGISMGLLESLGIEKIDTSDVINMILNIEGVEVAVILKEVEEGVKGSLRSKNDFDVRKVAEVFGGGGHVKASGLKILNISLDDAKEKILTEIEKEMKL